MLSSTTAALHPSMCFCACSIYSGVCNQIHHRRDVQIFFSTFLSADRPPFTQNENFKGGWWETTNKLVAVCPWEPYEASCLFLMGQWVGPEIILVTGPFPVNWMLLVLRYISHILWLNCGQFSSCRNGFVLLDLKQIVSLIVETQIWWIPVLQVSLDESNVSVFLKWFLMAFNSHSIVSDSFRKLSHFRSPLMCLPNVHGVSLLI